MGFNGYDPYPGESYISVTPGGLHTLDYKGNVIPGDLEARVAPLLEIYARLRSVQDSLKLVVDRDYNGVFDGFSGDGTSGSIYRLFLDRLHLGYNFWSKKVSIKGKSFQFKPNQYFRVYGTVIESGNLNDFDYYFVRT